MNKTVLVFLISVMLPFSLFANIDETHENFISDTDPVNSLSLTANATKEQEAKNQYAAANAAYQAALAAQQAAQEASEGKTLSTTAQAHLDDINTHVATALASLQRALVAKNQAEKRAARRIHKYYRVQQSVVQEKLQRAELARTRATQYRSAAETAKTQADSETAAANLQSALDDCITQRDLAKDEWDAAVAAADEVSGLDSLPTRESEPKITALNSAITTLKQSLNTDVAAAESLYNETVTKCNAIQARYDQFYQSNGDMSGWQIVSGSTNTALLNAQTGEYTIHDGTSSGKGGIYLPININESFKITGQVYLGSGTIRVNGTYRPVGDGMTLSLTSGAPNLSGSNLGMPSNAIAGGSIDTYEGGGSGPQDKIYIKSDESYRVNTQTANLANGQYHNVTFYWDATNKQYGLQFTDNLGRTIKLKSGDAISVNSSGTYNFTITAGNTTWVGAIVRAKGFSYTKQTSAQVQSALSSFTQVGGLPDAPTTTYVTTRESNVSTNASYAANSGTRVSLTSYNYLTYGAAWQKVDMAYNWTMTIDLYRLNRYSSESGYGMAIGIRPDNGNDYAVGYGGTTVGRSFGVRGLSGVVSWLLRNTAGADAFYRTPSDGITTVTGDLNLTTFDGPDSNDVEKYPVSLSWNASTKTLSFTMNGQTITAPSGDTSGITGEYYVGVGASTDSSHRRTFQFSNFRVTYSD